MAMSFYIVCLEIILCWSEREKRAEENELQKFSFFLVSL